MCRALTSRYATSVVLYIGTRFSLAGVVGGPFTWTALSAIPVDPALSAACIRLPFGDRGRRAAQFTLHKCRDRRRIPQLRNEFAEHNATAARRRRSRRGRRCRLSISGDSSCWWVFADTPNSSRCHATGIVDEREVLGGHSEQSRGGFGYNCIAFHSATSWREETHRQKEPGRKKPLVGR